MDVLTVALVEDCGRVGDDPGIIEGSSAGVPRLPVATSLLLRSEMDTPAVNDAAVESRTAGETSRGPKSKTLPCLQVSNAS